MNKSCKALRIFLIAIVLTVCHPALYAAKLLELIPIASTIEATETTTATIASTTEATAVSKEEAAQVFGILDKTNNYTQSLHFRTSTNCPSV
ncbi:hypothetical protein FACS1894199_08410 [Bacteroidia bacterium]|nr:hypothetical protein FACS1894199_08410 [Bacteroidia bacterium]